jgi:hypothetical protein
VLDRGGRGLEVTAEAGNDAARRFEHRMDAPVVPRVFYRYDADALARLAAGDPN